MYIGNQPLQLKINICVIRQVGKNMHKLVWLRANFVIPMDFVVSINWAYLLNK